MVDRYVIIMITAVKIILSLCGCDMTAGFVRKPPTRRCIEIAYTTRRPNSTNIILYCKFATQANPYYNTMRIISNNIFRKMVHIFPHLFISI